MCRGIYSGRLLYVAHNVEEAEKVPFWANSTLSAFRSIRRSAPTAIAMAGASRCGDVADRLDALAARTGKSIVVGEIGIALGAWRRGKSPGKAPEERATTSRSLLSRRKCWPIGSQSSIGRRSAASWSGAGSPIPNAGGLNDTDFTVQGKPAEHVSDVPMDAKLRRQRQGNLSGTLENGVTQVSATQSELAPDAEDHAVFLQRIAAGIGGDSRRPAATRSGSAHRPR